MDKNKTQIKLIIFDLDETFWDGTLSDGNACINQDNIALIKNMVDAGVMASICSKNDNAEVEAFLADTGIWDLFVFKSINWSPKGQRVKQIIEEMQLRAPNVLFIDDNPSNLGEVEAFNPGIMVCGIEELPNIRKYYSEIIKNDLSHKRLKQYYILEKKKEFKAVAGSNDDFLYKSDIRVEISTDANNNIERIYDLVQRSNQLNFTKVRSSKKELTELCNNKNIKTGYVSVKDSFGDYGIVGFYAIQNSRALHFVFSCRTLNMGVEQYVYHVLGCPKLDIVGEVSSSLDVEMPKWINQEVSAQIEKKENLVNGKILLKGPCDLSQMFAYIEESDNIIQEFVYVGEKGVSVEGANHTSQIIESRTLSEKDKKALISTTPFGDKNMFMTRMFDSDIHYVVLSLFTDPNLGVYRHKASGHVVAFGEWKNDLTNKCLWQQFINKELYVAGCNFTEENLNAFKEQYEYIGRLSPQEIVTNVRWIYNHISSDARLILTLGSEIAYEDNKQPSYEDRHIFHKELNAILKKEFADNERVSFLNVNDFINGQADFTGNINHFSRKVYFELATALINIINSEKEDSISVIAPYKRVVLSIKQELIKVRDWMLELFNKALVK